MNVCMDYECTGNIEDLCNAIEENKKEIEACALDIQYAKEDLEMAIDEQDQELFDDSHEELMNYHSKYKRLKLVQALLKDEAETLNNL